MIPPFARLLFGDDRTYDMRKRSIIIGRGTISSPVDVDVGSSAFVSRKHIELSWSCNTLRLKCNGKNGIFVDKNFKPYSSSAYAIPSSCTLRFPSTKICVTVNQWQTRGKASRKRKNSDNCCPSPNSYAPPATIDSDFSDIGSDSSCGKRKKTTFQFPTRTELKPDHTLATDISTSSSNPTALANDQSRTRRKQTLVPKDRLTPKAYPKNQLCGDTLDAGAQDSGILRSDDTTNQINEVISRDALTGEPHTTPSTHCVTPASFGQSHRTGGRILIASLSRLSQASVPLSPQTLIRVTEVTALERGDRETKPPYSYAQLIAQAITNQANRQLTLSGIYDYISQNYPYYQPHDKGWQNSVRHNLSLNRYFIKIQRSQEDHGKGCFWRIDPAYEAKVMNLAFRKRHARSAVYLSPQPSNSVLATAMPASTVVSHINPGLRHQLIEVQPPESISQMRLPSSQATKNIMPLCGVTTSAGHLKPVNMCYRVIKSSDRTSLPTLSAVNIQSENSCSSAKSPCLLVVRQMPRAILSFDESTN